MPAIACAALSAPRRMLAIVCLVLSVTLLAGGTSSASQARSTRSLVVTDIAHLHYVSASGSLLFEEGRAWGTLPGRMKTHFNVNADLRGSFTIFARGGSIRGHGSAILHGSGVYESFAGSLVATAGTGRYVHAYGRARLYGTFNRNNYALVVQTVGILRY
jgi:hypothetical protein